MNLNKSRKLNSLERFCSSLNQIAPFNCQIEGEFNGYLPVEILNKAIKIIQRKHFLLNASIKKDTIEPEFIYNPNLEIPISYLQNEDWLAFAETALNSYFDYEKGPLWSVLCVANAKGFHIILTFDHTIVDGLSGMLLLDDLIFVCDQLIRGEEKWNEHSVPEVIIDTDSFPMHCKELLFFAPKRPAMEGEYSAPMENRYTHFLPTHLPRDITQRFIDKCKSYNVSAHAGISAFLLTTLGKEFSIKTKSEMDVIFDLVAPISLRKLLRVPLPDTQLCMAALQIKTQHIILKKSDVWSLALEIHAKTQGVIDNGEIFLANKELLTAEQVPSEKIYRDRERKVPYVTFSNLGKVEFGKTLHYIIPVWVNFSGQMRIGQGTQWGLFFTGITPSFSNQLSLNLHYLSPYWNKKRAEEFKEELLICFEKI